MTKISLELDAALDKRLKQYALDHYTVAHGKQQQIIRDALIAFLDANEGKRQQKVIEIQPESVSEEFVEVCEPEPAPKPKARKTGGQKKPKAGSKERLTDADLEYIKTQRLAGMGWTDIGKGMNPERRASTVKAAVERMVRNGELPESALKKGGETESETANVGE